MRAETAPSPTAITSGASGADPVAPISARSRHPEILELPGIGGVDILGEKDAAILQRRPIAIGADDGAQIGHAYLEDAIEIHLVGLDDAGGRGFARPQQTPRGGEGGPRA